MVEDEQRQREGLFMIEAKRSCGTCEWWGKPAWEDRHGHCRIGRPQMRIREPGLAPASQMWPVTSEADWCGEWTKREGEEAKS